MKLKPQFRELSISGFDAEKRTIELSFSSEDPYERWWGIEVLGHDSENVDLTRLNNNAPLLFNHNRDQYIGVIESAYIKDKRGCSVVRLGTNDQANQIFQDIKDGILSKVSVGYEILEMRLESESNGVETYRVTRWKPYEVSIVTIPADDTVGIGRDAELTEKEITIKSNKREVKKMDPEVNVEGVKAEAVKSDRARVQEILAIGEKYQLQDMAREACSNGESLDLFRAKVLEKIGTAKPIDTKAAEVGMNEKELQRYSLSKALSAHITGDWSKAGLEREASQAVAKMLRKDARGFYVPHDVLQRDLTTTAGASIVATQTLSGSFIDVLRSRLVLGRLGAQTLSGLSGNIAIPKQSAGTTAYWIDEGEDTTNSDLTLGLLSLSPKTVSGKTGYTRQMLLQGNPSVDALVMRDLASTLGLAIDKAGFNGTGADGQPKGIFATSGIGAVDCSGGLSWAKVVEFETDITAEDADINTMYYVAGANVTGTLKTTEKSNGTAKYLLEDGQVNGYDFIRANQIGAGKMIFGDFSQLIIALWGGLDIMVDPYAKADSGGVVVRAFQSLDLGVRYSQAFSATSNIA